MSRRTKFVLVTGGVVSAIAEKVGCDWHTAKKWIEDHPTIKRAWEAEKHRITDRARHNVLVAIQDGDLQTSKWWLQVLDEEFKPKQQIEHTGEIPVIREVIVRVPDVANTLDDE